MKPFKSIILILVVLLLFHSMAFGDDTELTRETLKGIEGVYVHIDFDDDLIQLGLSESRVRKDIEKKLRKAGIKVVSVNESLKLPGAPRLNVLANRLIQGKYLLDNIELELKQAVLLERNNLSVKLRTWSVEFTGLTSSKEKIRSIIKDMTYNFINAYFAVN